MTARPYAGADGVEESDTGPIDVDYQLREHLGPPILRTLD